MKGLTKRIITGVIFVAIIVACIFGGEATFIGLALMIVILCSFELLGILLPASETTLLKKLFGISVSLVPCIYIYGYNIRWWADNVQPFAILGIIGAIVFIVELFSKSAKPFTAAGSLLITLIYIGVPLALMIDLAQISEPYDPIILLSIFLFTWASDTGAYFIGSMIGNHKLMERISPNKTIEGFLGGVIVAIIVSNIFSHLFGGMTYSEWIILAIIVSVTATLGDLVESMLKRSMNIKDSGTWLPGHGGFLDRFDGFLFTIPFVYFYLKTFVL